MIDVAYSSEMYTVYGEAQVTLTEHNPRPLYQSGLAITAVSPLSRDWKPLFASPNTVS